MAEELLTKGLDAYEQFGAPIMGGQEGPIINQNVLYNMLACRPRNSQESFDTAAMFYVPQMYLKRFHGMLRQISEHKRNLIFSMMDVPNGIFAFAPIFVQSVITNNVEIINELPMFGNRREVQSFGRQSTPISMTAIVLETEQAPMLAFIHILLTELFSLEEVSKSKVPLGFSYPGVNMHIAFQDASISMNASNTEIINFQTQMFLLGASFSSPELASMYGVPNNFSVEW